MTQTAANHIRLDPLFGIGTLLFVPGAGILIGMVIRYREMFPSFAIIGSFMMFGGVILLWTRLRRYPLTVQDRLIRLEEKLRYQRLGLGDEDRLTLSQIIALRFASDQELPALIERTVRDTLTPKQIKQAITMWRPDTLRV